MVDELPRQFDFAELPDDMSEVSRRTDFAIGAMPVSRLALPLRVAEPKRLLEIVLGLQRSPWQRQARPAVR